MATLWDEIVFVEECNFVNDGRRFFIDEKDEEEYEISETDLSDFSSEFSEREDTSSSEKESFQAGARKKVRKSKLPKKPVENKQQTREAKLEGRKISSSQKRNWTQLFKAGLR